MDFQQKIKDKGLKQGWIAKQIGVNQALLSFYLTETRPMPELIKEKLKLLLN